MPVYVMKPSVVRKAIDDLDSRKIHPHFPAYLGLTRLAKREGTTHDLSFNYETYYDQYFRVQADEDRNMVIDGSEKLYLVPFTNPHGRSMWKGENVAGSISVGTAGRSKSSVGLNNVVDIDIDSNTYSLKDDHWELARNHLTYEEKVPAEPVAVFMYRDWGFESDEPPELSDLVELSRKEFGFEDDDQFDHLFIDSYDLGVTDPFEVYDDD